MAAYSVTTAGAKFQYSADNKGSTSGRGTSSSQVDANHFITFWYGTDYDGFSQVLTINTSTWAVTTANSALEFDTQTGNFNSCYKIDTNHFINFWSGGAASHAYVQAFTVNTTTFAVTTANASLDFDGNGLDHWNNCYKIDTNHFINFYVGSANDGYVQVFTVNTTTWAVTTANSALEFETQLLASSSCFPVDANHFINFFTGVSDDGAVQVFTVNTTTWAVTTSGAKLTFSTQTTSFHACYLIDSTHAINFWQDDANNALAQVFAINTSTWAVSTAAASLNYNTANGSVATSVQQIDSSHYIVWYGGKDEDGFVNTFTVNTSNWTISKTSALEFDTGYGFSHGSYKIDTYHFIDVYAASNYPTDGSSDKGGASVFAVEEPPVAPTVTTAACTSVTKTSFVANGEITATGGANATVRGFCFKVGTSGDPTIADRIQFESGSFGVGTFDETIDTI